MPIIERVVGRKKVEGKRSVYKTAKHMKNVIRYITGKVKTEDSLVGSRNILNKDNAYNEFVLTKMLYNKMPKNDKDESKRMVVHFVQSFDPKDKNITPELAKKIADEFAGSIYFKEFQVLYSVHTDRKHIHTHFVVNTTNFVDGRAWQQSKEELEAMKQLSDRIALKHGIRIINDRKKSRGLHVENSEFQANKRGAGWKKEIFEACKEAKKQSSSIEEFISRLKEDGIEVRISASRKDITYRRGSKKINSDKLGFPKKGYTPFTKEELARCFAEKIKNEQYKEESDVRKEVAENDFGNKDLYIYMLNDIERLFSSDDVINRQMAQGHHDGEMARLDRKNSEKGTKGMEL